MRRFVILLGIGLAISVIYGFGQFIWPILQQELRSRVLWRQVDRGPGTVVDFAQLGLPKWDRVYIFQPYTPRQAIYEALGFQWPDAERTSIEYGHGLNLVVFVKGMEVVAWFEHPRNRGDLVDLANMAGYSENQARFVVALDSERRLVLIAAKT